ncbi:MAG: hypothetical protein AAF355_09740 [Myxococcota bacterium]
MKVSAYVCPGSVAIILMVAFTNGCLLQNVSYSEKLRDNVHELNDELRWGRMDLAVTRVAPPYRVAFADMHRPWGRTIQIADLEIQSLDFGEDRSEAASIVTFRWYSETTMTLRETTIRQKWERSISGYAITEVEVIEGDPSLLSSTESTG